jgi:hypothetical protein
MTVEKCTHVPWHDLVTDTPLGPECGQPATQLICWKDGRTSFACAKHGFETLDAAARLLVDHVEPRHHFFELKGKTLTSIEGTSPDSDEVILVCDDETRYRMFHNQQCCEEVCLLDVCGDLNDVIGRPIELADEAKSDTVDPSEKKRSYAEWTFYRLATVKGYVTMRWFGATDSSYSLDVEFEKL